MARDGEEKEEEEEERAFQLKVAVGIQLKIYKC